MIRTITSFPWRGRKVLLGFYNPKNITGNTINKMDSGQKVLEGVNKGDRSVDAIIIANKLINRAGINLISDPKGARVRLEKAERLLDAVLGANYRMIRNEPGNYDPANPFADQFARIYAYYDYLNTNKV